MRGKVLSPTDINEHHGITPAYAGKRTIGPTGHCVQRDHPRICGEKRWRVVEPEVGRGITPAYAGKREVYFRAMHRPWDHPRICGEKAHERRHQAVNEGSPPHMRGKALLRERRHCVVGITPAYAGKREFTSGRCIALGDHPRICGEKTKKIP